ncbi:adenine deaminase C-terminal domain-containing protein [Frankia sp. AgKG'84/4]
MSTPHPPGRLPQAAATHPVNPHVPPPQTPSPQVMPSADRPDVPAPARPAGRPPVRLFGADRLRASDAQLARMRRVARGEEDADLVVRGGLVVVVQDGSVVSRDVLIVGRHIAAVTRPGALGGRRSLDAAGRYVLPAYVDPGLRIEDTLLSPGELARLLVPRGTGTLLADPTALIALGGIRGPEFAAGSGTPLRVLIRSGGTPDAALSDTVGPTGSTGAGGELAGMSTLDADSAEGLRRALEAAGLAGSRTVTELAYQGHIDHDVRLAVGGGASPIDAIRRATLLPARAYGLDSILGAVAPARLADLQVVSTLADTAPPDVVVAGGRIAAEHGRPLFDNLDAAPDWAAGRIQLPVTLHAGSFAGPDLARVGRGDGSIAAVSIDAGAGPTIPPVAAPPVPVSGAGVRVVRVVPTVREGRAVADATRDLQKVAVLGRAGGPETAEIGLVRGCGLSRGALGFTTAQAPGRVVVIGTRDDDMLTAARAVEGMGGGFVVVDQGWVRAACPLPLLGLLSDAPWEAVLGELAAVDTAAADLGCRLPFPLRTLARFGSQLHTGP